MTSNAASDAPAAQAAPASPLRHLLQSLLHDYLFWILLLVLAGLSVAAPSGIAGYPQLVDWPTMATLTGLLMLTKGVELSGFLHRMAAHLMARMQSERALALFLVAAAALLATILTNDVALFVIVPLTLTLRGVVQSPPAADSSPDAPQDAARDGKQDATPPTTRGATGTALRPSSGGLPITRLIIFEALAANAGSALTPIGNPQNLYLWQQSQVSFASFTVAMLPLTLLLLGALALLTVFCFSGRPNPPHAHEADAAVDRPLLLTCLTLYLPFLLMTDLHHAPGALAALTLIFLVAYRQVLARIDWGLLLVFILMFIDLRLVGAAGPVRTFFAGAGLAQLENLYLAAIAASQVISNVPATILLAQYTHDWRVLAYGVNVGGAGLAIGSLANIIALRMAPEKRAWWVFHAYSVPFLLVTGAIGLAWLTLR
jgi:di/tricarboxylate transporter